MKDHPHISIKPDDNTIYVSRIEPTSATEDPLTISEKVILHQYRKIQELEDRIELIIKWNKVEMTPPKK